jgi:hypothetical protein
VLGPENGAAVEEEWAVWRIVLSRTAALSEIETHWSLDDLVRANLALDVQQAAEA